jgi:DNA-binding MarR family transcriptional regulator
MSGPDFMSSLKNLVYEVNYLRERLVREEKLSFTSIFLITFIDMKGPKSLTEISEILGLSKSTITHLVDGLESKGYVIREYSSGDRRIVTVHLSHNGMKFLSYQNDIMERIRVLLMAIDPDQLRNTSVILDQISGMLAEEREKGEKIGKSNL